MKLLLLSPEFFLAEGGIARVMRIYLKALCEIADGGEPGAGGQGRVDSIVLNDPAGRDGRLVRYANSRLGEHIGCDRSQWRFIRQALRLAKRADLLICGHLHQLPVARLAQLANPRLKYCLVAHGIEVWRPYGLLERRALLGAHRILCVSEFTRRQMLRFHPRLSARRLLVVPNTPDPFFAPVTGGTTPATPFASPRILTVARLTSADSYKGIDTLIEALPLVRRDFPFAHLRVVGQGDDLPRLHALVARLGVAQAVEFTGPLADDALRAEYAACDIFALPSRREGFGLVFLEAMMHGKPCLGARAGGVPEIITTEDVGRLVEYGNISDIASALADLSRHPRDSGVVRAHADAFAFPAFQRRLAAALG